MTAKENIINKIKDLYPVDSVFNETKVVGQFLLGKAIEKVGWQKLPNEFLAQYLIECANEEHTSEISKKLIIAGII